MPVIGDLAGLAGVIRLSAKCLYWLSKRADYYYRPCEIPKSSGGFRQIHCPSPELKAVQAWILRSILDNIPIAPAATGFRPLHNILDNAQRHEGNTHFLCLDIRDFFPSISYGRVFATFRNIGYGSHISHIFTSLCTRDGRLPQGAVTSPSLSNIVCRRLDRRIAGYVGRRDIVYSRYADDMTFSSRIPPELTSAKPFVTAIIRDEGFELNQRKTRVLGPRRRRRITGIVVSDDGLGVGKHRKKALRAAIHRFLWSGKQDTSDMTSSLRHYIQGWLAHLHSVDCAGYGQLRGYAERLCAKHSLPGFSTLFSNAATSE